jgi:hypothetical protein
MNIVKKTIQKLSPVLQEEANLILRNIEGELSVYDMRLGPSSKIELITNINTILYHYGTKAAFTAIEEYKKVHG